MPQHRRRSGHPSVPRRPCWGRSISVKGGRAGVRPARATQEARHPQWSGHAPEDRTEADTRRVVSGCGLEARVGWQCALPPRGTAEENQWGGQRVGCLVPEGHPGGGEQRAGGRPGPGLWEARSGVTGQGLVYCGGRVRRGRDSGWRRSEGSRAVAGDPPVGLGRAGRGRAGPARAGTDGRRRWSSPWGEGGCFWGEAALVVCRRKGLGPASAWVGGHRCRLPLSAARAGGLSASRPPRVPPLQWPHCL